MCIFFASKPQRAISLSLPHFTRLTNTSVMLQLLPAIAIFALLIFLFFRETRLDQKKLDEADREGDAHIMREIEKFYKEKGPKI